MYRTGRSWKTKKVPHWVVFVLALGLYFLLIWQLWPFLSASEMPFFKYFGYFFILVFTKLFLVLAKIYISQLLNYKSSYPILNEKSQFKTDDSDFY
jgi:hypothetical protein